MFLCSTSVGKKRLVPSLKGDGGHALFLLAKRLDSASVTSVSFHDDVKEDSHEEICTPVSLHQPVWAVDAPYVDARGWSACIWR